MKKRHVNAMLMSAAASILALLPAAAIPAPEGSDAQIDERKAAIVKAGYLRFLAEFTIWPETAFKEKKTPIEICILGDDPHGVARIMEKAIQKKRLTAQRRRIKLHRMKFIPVPADAAADPQGALGRREFTGRLRRCHLLFLTRSRERIWPDICRIVDGAAVVTISDIKGFSASKGMIEFVVASADGRIRMHIDLEAVRKAELRLSSKLLSLKTRVKIVKRPADSEA